MPQPANDTAEILGLDVHTLKDLEIFESETGDASLFDFCNFTRTRGGAAALRRRMERPWSNVGRIRVYNAAGRRGSTTRSC